MKKTLIKFVSGIFILAFIGCSPVRFYSNAELTKNSGFKYYTVKPYLQVERDPATNNIVKATILYLPDLENPQYVAIKDGLGSRKLDLKLTDGTMTALGLDTDPLIAETLTAIGNIVSKTASAVTDLSMLKSVPPTAASSTVTELYDIIMTNGITSVKKIEVK
jgi:hypothetical protein